MNEIVVTVRDKIATGDGTRIVCGNSDYIVRFDLDSEWEQLDGLTMVVVYADKTYTEVLCNENRASLPAISNQLYVEIGLYAGNMRTTTPAAFDCVKSVRCDLIGYADPVTVKNFGAENAGKLLYVGSDGYAAVLAVGEGLEIRDGVLVVTSTGVVVAELSVDADGNAVITGATLAVDDNGNCTITGAALTVDELGNATLT